jgi:hypothetical protein
VIISEIGFDSKVAPNGVWDATIRAGTTADSSVNTETVSGYNLLGLSSSHTSQTLQDTTTNIATNTGGQTESSFSYESVVFVEEHPYLTPRMCYATPDGNGVVSDDITHYGGQLWSFNGGPFNPKVFSYWSLQQQLVELWDHNFRYAFDLHPRWFTYTLHYSSKDGVLGIGAIPEPGATATQSVAQEKRYGVSLYSGGNACHATVSGQPVLGGMGVAAAGGAVDYQTAGFSTNSNGYNFGFDGNASIGAGYGFASASLLNFSFQDTTSHQVSISNGTQQYVTATNHNTKGGAVCFEGDSSAAGGAPASWPVSAPGVDHGPKTVANAVLTNFYS